MAGLEQRQKMEPINGGRKKADKKKAENKENVIYSERREGTIF